MSQKSDDSLKNKRIKQNNYIPILLWLFPLLLLNIGWRFFKAIDRYWEEQEQIEYANQVTESLAAKSDFSYCFASIAGKFNESLQSDTEHFTDEKLVSVIASRSQSIFKYPFPKYDLMVFKIASDSLKTDLLYTTDKNISGKRAYCITFKYLVNVNLDNFSYSDEERKKGADIAKSVISGDSNPTILAETQKAKTTFVNYKSKTNYFIWDYFTNPNSGDVFGFFVFVKYDVDVELAGRLLAVEELSKSRYKKNKIFGAFIPLFSNYGGIVASEELYKIPEFSKKVREWVPNNLDELYQWLEKGSPIQFSDTLLGDYKAYFHINPNASHAAVILLPLLEKIKFPTWLSFIDITVLTLITLLLIRGFLLGIWPKTSLKVRFFSTYFLAACLPIGLLIIALYGYISEFSHTSVFKNQSQLKLCIGQFDSRKTQTQEEYKTAFLDIQNDPLVLEAFNRLDKVNEKPINSLTPEAIEIVHRILNVINKNGRELPIIGFSIIDERGGYLTNLGNEFCPYYVSSDKKEYRSENTIWNHDIKKKHSFNEEYMDVYLYPLLTMLQKRIEKTGLNNKRWKEEYKPTLIQKVAVGSFDSMGDEQSVSGLVGEFENHINNIYFTSNGVQSYGRIHNLININGIPRFIIYLHWDESQLDKKSLESTIRYLAMNERYYDFMVFKADSQGVKPWVRLNKNKPGEETYKKFLSLAKLAYFRKSSVFDRSDDMSMVAVPSKKFKDTIIIGSVFYNELSENIFKRIWVCIAIIVIALLIFIACIHYSSIIFVKPIVNLKNILDKVSDGNFDINIKSNSQDEFGIMCHEFSEMTKELSERNKLATLISDHAIEALSKNASGSDNNDVETFNGTVLVSDIRNFTGMCESHNPDQVTELLDNHFSKMTRIISSNGGRIYKYIGDAIEVVFSDKDDSSISSTRRAFKCSFEMLKCLKNINEERNKKGLFEYKVGIGLSYGKMSSGTIGNIETRMDYAILGDALKNAAILEGFSRNYPEFPLIVDNSFKNLLNKQYPDIEFESINDDKIRGFKVSDKGISLFSKLVENENNTSDSISNSNPEKANDLSKNKLDNFKTYEVEEYFSFARKFVPGLFFVIILAVIFGYGIDFVYNTAHNSEKIMLSLENNRAIEQIRCEDSAKTIFDIKCRNIASKLNNYINALNKQNVNKENISNFLDELIDSDKSLKGLKVNRLFIKLDKEINLENNRINYIDDISFSLFYNRGFSIKDVEYICNSFKLTKALNSIDIITENLKLNSKDSEDFKFKCKNYMKENYGEPSVKVFGDKISILYLKDKSRNATVEGSYDGEDCYLFYLDYFDNETRELIGYLLITIPVEQVKNSIQMLLSAYSKDETLVAIKNTYTKDWYFSDNYSEHHKKGVLQSDSNSDVINKNGILKIENNYLNNLLADTADAIIDIGGIPHKLYLTKLCSLNRGNPTNALFWVLVIIIGISIVLWKVSKGTSRINTSIAAKLWVALLITAVIPVITVFFFFGLFRSEYYFVMNSINRAGMQRYGELFEQKDSFSTPLIWNYIKKKNNSNELRNYIKVINNASETENLRTSSMNNLRKLVQSWVDEIKINEDNNPYLFNYNISDVSICGINDWSFCLTDKQDSLKGNKLNLNNINTNDEVVSSVSYINANNNASKKSFSDLLKELGKSILNKKSEKKITNSISQNSFSDTAIEMGLDAIKTFYGDDFYLKFIYEINKPIYLEVGTGRLGFMVSPIPSIEKPEFVIVWMVMFNDNDYLVRLSNKLNSDYNVNFVDKQKYGNIYKLLNNNWRIPLAGYANWMTTSNLPISATLKYENRIKYAIEGRPALRKQNSLVLLTLPELSIYNDIIYFSVVFYLLLGFSLMIIISTTRNIADDILNPIRMLITGIRELNRENFSYRINSDRSDELGALCLSFDKMVKGLDEKRLMTKMLSNTARVVTLKENSSVTDTRKSDCILLYIGIPNFSSLIIGLTEQEIFASLKRQTTIIAECVMKNFGEVDKIMGERILSVFSVKNNETKIANNVCKVAETLIELEKNKELPFPIAIGINYGNVINGFLGFGSKRDFTVIGDAVNVTARIESLSEKLVDNRCLISETFYALIEESFNPVIYGEVELKGKAKPMKVYQFK